MLSLFKCITCSSSLAKEEIKLFTIANVLDLFMIPIKYGLILFRYSSGDNALFPSLLLSYST